MEGEYIGIENAKKIAACDEYRRRLDRITEYIEKIDNREFINVEEVRNIYKLAKGDNNEN